MALTIPVTKSYEDENGNLYVEGLATSDALDLDGQIIDKEFARAGLEKWFADWGNVRQMHSSNLAPAGKAVDFQEVPGGFWVKTLVVEPTAKQLVRQGVYQAYSVGIARPRIVRDQVAKNGRVIDGVFSEISLVDFPANPQCKFSLAKMADSGSIEILEKVEQPDLTKRDFDRSTGGGVDRDKLPASDFAGPDRSFPIVTPGDVSDAAHLVGKAADPDAVKANIIAIAHRKGAAFVAELPESWKADAAKDLDPDLDKARGEWKDGKKPFPGAAKPFGKGDADDAAKDKADDDADDKSEKKAGRRFSKGDAVKWNYRSAVGHGTVQGVHKDADDPDEVAYSIAEHDHHPGEPDTVVHYGRALSPDDAAKSAAGEARLGLAKHPEPDGDEHGPDLDDDEGGHGLARKTTTGAQLVESPSAADESSTKAVNYHLSRLHDALCPAYRDDDVLIAHPSLVRGLAAVLNPSWFVDQLVTAAQTQAPDAPALLRACTAAQAVSHQDEDLSRVALDGMRKAFETYYPTAHPTPTDMVPGEFGRGFITTGRANDTAGAGPRIPLQSHVPTPQTFNRGPLTEGQEAVSKQRTYYTNDAKAQAGQNLAALHDWIAAQHPEVCPVHAPAPDGEPAFTGSAGSSLTAQLAASTVQDNRSDAAPRPVTEAQLDAVHASFDPEMVKHLAQEAVEAATAPLHDEIDALSKRIQAYEAEPDPAAAAPRHATAVAEATPEVATGGDEADPAQVAKLVRLVKRARSRDSEVSRPAYEELISEFGPDALAELL